MKKKSNLFRVGILFTIVCASVALLEIFDLHPEFSIGKFHSLWVGVRHMDFVSSTTTVPVSGGEKVTQKDYDLGPIKVAIEM